MILVNVINQFLDYMHYFFLYLKQANKVLNIFCSDVKKKVWFI